MSNTPNSSDNLFADVLKKAEAPDPAPKVASEPPQAPEEDELKVDELEMLKNKARLMGISFSNNLKDPAVLRAKIEEKMAADAAKDNEAPGDEPATTAENTPEQAKPVKKKSLRQEIFEREMKLVRLRITNMDPKKKDLPGEIITVANEYLGTVRKYVPFGEATDNGYHVPFCIYTALKERQFLQVRTRKGKNGTPIPEAKYVREFSLEELPPLTETELARLAAAQAAAGGLKDD